jgi:hypothetical protein
VQIAHESCLEVFHQGLIIRTLQIGDRPMFKTEDHLVSTFLESLWIGSSSPVSTDDIKHEAQVGRNFPPNSLLNSNTRRYYAVHQTRKCIEQAEVHVVDDESQALVQVASPRFF